MAESRRSSRLASKRSRNGLIEEKTEVPIIKKAKKITNKKDSKAEKSEHPEETKNNENTEETEKVKSTEITETENTESIEQDGKTEKAEKTGSAKSDELEVGELLPEDLEVELQDSSKVNLLEFAKKSHILIIFAYPKASTPGCTRQAKGFRDEYKELHDDLKAGVLGLSADNSKSQTNFKVKQGLPYDLICDTQKKLIKLLGCKKSPSGIIRSHFVFVDGVLKVKKIRVSPEDSFKGALLEAKTFSK